MWSAWALGVIGDRSAFDALVSALDEDNRDVRCHAALALGRIGDPEAVPILEAFLKTENDELTRTYAVRGIGHFAWRPDQEEARRILKGVADDETCQPTVRSAASEELRAGTTTTAHEVTCVQTKLLDVPPEGTLSGAEAVPDGPLGTSVQRRTVTTRVPQRDKQAKEAYKNRVGTRCQVCGEPGFSARGGSEFCEVHHIVPIASGGFDSPPNLLVVCPTCHRKLHFARSVRFEPDPWDRRPSKVCINGRVFDIDWRKSISEVDDSSPPS